MSDKEGFDGLLLRQRSVWVHVRRRRYDLELELMVAMDDELRRFGVFDDHSAIPLIRVTLSISASVLDLVRPGKMHVYIVHDTGGDIAFVVASVGVHGAVGINAHSTRIRPDGTTFKFLGVPHKDTWLSEVLGTAANVVANLSGGGASRDSRVRGVAEKSCGLVVVHFAMSLSTGHVVNTELKAVGRSELEKLALVPEPEGLPGLLVARFGASIHANSGDHLEDRKVMGEHSFKHVGSAGGAVDFRGSSVFYCD